MEKGYLREGADRVVRGDTSSVLIVYRHTGIAIADIGHDSVEEKPCIIRREESRCSSLDKGIEATGIENVVIGVRVLIECRILPPISRIKNTRQ